MFDQKYYEDKKVKLEQRLAQKKNRVIGLMAQTMQTYFDEEREIMADIQEINMRMETRISPPPPVLPSPPPPEEGEKLVEEKCIEE